MRHRLFGRTGLSVSEISLGTVELGLEYGFHDATEVRKPPYEQAAKVLARALELGVNFIDTARGYGDAEQFIGDAIGHRRAEYALASKVASHGGDATAILKSVETSLRMLKTERLDVLYLHSTATESPAGPAAQALLQAQHLGLTRFIGASVYGPAAAREAIGWGGYDCIQMAWSLLDRRPEAEVLRLAAERNVGIAARSVLMRGALTHRRAHLPASLAPVTEAASQLELLATSRGLTLPELAYRYVLSHRGPYSALVGTANIGELEAAVSYAEAGPLAPDLTKAVHAVALSNPDLADLSRWPS